MTSSLPAGSADLSSLSLAVSRTTGEQPSAVPARLRAQDGGGGRPVEAALGMPLVWGFAQVHLSFALTTCIHPPWLRRGPQTPLPPW